MKGWIILITSKILNEIYDNLELIDLWIWS